MRTTFACLIIAGAIAGCQGNSGTQQPETDSTKKDTIAPAPVEMTTNILTDEEKNAGWQLLFDGASKSNFHVFNKKSDGSAWQQSAIAVLPGTKATSSSPPLPTT